MINAEKWKDEILECVNTDGIVALCKGKPTPCNKMDCNDCDLYDINGGCGNNLIRWMLKEYMEYPKLTERQHTFCQTFPSKWLVRHNEQIYLYEEKPTLSDGGIMTTNVPNAIALLIPKKFIEFPFIKPIEQEKNEIYSTSEMLTWEVEE